MHLWESDFLVEHPPTSRVRWDVITSVREPVGQGVSAFFHARARAPRIDDKADLDAMREQLIAEEWLERPARWFEREFTPGLGVDALSSPFDPELGTSTLDGDRVRVLFLRQENLDAAPTALRDFLGLDEPVDIPRRNEATSRDDAALYRDFVENVRLPAEVVDGSYATPYSRHFYSDAELAHLRTRWTDNTVAS